MPDVDGYLDLVATAGSIGLALQSLSPGDREDVKAQTGAALGAFEGLTGLEIPGAALCVIAQA